MNKILMHQIVPRVMVAVGGMAVVAGGVVSAFLAHRPSELAMWASAYLVLVAGVAQIAFGASLYYLSRPTSAASLWVALILYNLANAGVLLGTTYKTTAFGPMITTAGGIGLMVALGFMLLGTRGARKSWALYVFYGITAVILLSIPIGLWLARQ
jgi:hypothetical protein